MCPDCATEDMSWGIQGLRSRGKQWAGHDILNRELGRHGGLPLRDGDGVEGVGIGRARELKVCGPFSGLRSYRPARTLREMLKENCVAPRQLSRSGDGGLLPL